MGDLTNYIEIGSVSAIHKKDKSHEQIMSTFHKSKDVDSYAEFHEQKQAFLKIFCAQLTCQLPDERTDLNEHTRTIYQMMNTEQIMKMNQRLDESNNHQKSLRQSGELNYIDTPIQVKVNSSTFSYEGEPINLSYELSSDVNNPVIEIYNSKDLKHPVFTSPLTAKNGQFVWDGKLTNGEIAHDGAYTMRVKGDSIVKKDKEGKSLTIEGKTFLHLGIDDIKRDEETGESIFISGKMAFLEKDIRAIQKKPEYDAYKQLQKKLSPKDVTEISTQTEKIIPKDGDQQIEFNPNPVHENYAKNFSTENIANTIDQSVNESFNEHHQDFFNNFSTQTIDQTV